MTYNGENRPVKFVSWNKRIEISCDYMDRLVGMAYWINNAVEKERRFFYDGYLLTQEMKWDNTVLKEFTWDPAELTATKPLTMTVNSGVRSALRRLGAKTGAEIAVEKPPPADSRTMDTSGSK